MAKHPLYVPTAGWDLSILPAPFNSIQPKTTDSSCFSEYHSLAKQSVALHAYACNAVINYSLGANSNIALISIGSGAFATEAEMSTGETALFVLYPNGQCKGAIRSNTGRHSPINPLAKADTFDTSFIFLAALARLCEESQAVEATLVSTRATATESALYYLSDALEGALNDNKLKVVMTGGNIDLLTAQTIDTGALNGTVICGQPKVLNRRKSDAVVGTMQFADAMTEFADWRKRHTWTDEEQELIPAFPADYPVMPETMKICRRYVGTHEDKRPMLNFMWRGVTSYGKSTGVELMAALLNMPLLRVTCHTTMETQDFLSNIVPVSKREQVGALPSFDEIAYDPESAYLAITGEEKEGVTPEECLAAYGEACAAKASQGSGSLFKQVEECVY